MTNILPASSSLSSSVNFIDLNFLRKNIIRGSFYTLVPEKKKNAAGSIGLPGGIGLPSGIDREGESAAVDALSVSEEHSTATTIVKKKRKFNLPIAQAKDLRTAVMWMTMYITTLATLYDTQHLAIVFDIDDTVLTYLANDMVHGSKLLQQFYEEARKLGYSVYFVTARPDIENNLESTMKELQSLGFKNPNGLFLLPLSLFKRTSSSAAFYKYQTRLGIEMNFSKRIILNIGNIWEDLTCFYPYCMHRWGQKLKKRFSPDAYYIVEIPREVSVVSIKLPEFYRD
jgi:hypothetical protein